MEDAGAGLSSSAAIVCSSAIAILTALDKSSSKVILLFLFSLDVFLMCPQARDFPAPLHSSVLVLFLSRLCTI
jgi:hypothetical protein